MRSFFLGCATVLCCGLTTTTVASDAVDRSAARRATVRDELKAWNAGLSATVRRQKYDDMTDSALGFYRATAHLYYQDMARRVLPIPTSWPMTTQISTWGSGDYHIQNVGFFHNRDAKIVLDLNDFDESWIAPFYFDIIRFVGSIYLHMGTTSPWTLNSSEADSMAEQFVAQYQAALESVDGNSSERTVVLDATVLDGPMRKKALDLAAKRTPEDLLDKWTVKTAGRRMFDLSNPDLARLTTDEQRELDGSWASYTSSLGVFAGSRPPGYFAIKDRAMRLHSGLGSRGVTKFYVLIEGPSTSLGDDVLLEVKANRRPAMLDSILASSVPLYTALFGDRHGERALTASRANLAGCDLHFGWLSSARQTYHVRTLSPWKYGYEPDDFGSKKDMTQLVIWASRALAYAHARGDMDFDTRYVGYQAEEGILRAIRAWPRAKAQLRELGAQYAEQVRADYDLFLALRRSGEL
jgi:uncharacterized protein (DUF2252 family)